MADAQDIPTLVNSKRNQWAKLSAAYTSVCKIDFRDLAKSAT